jgi:hypothetical protein
MRENCTSGIAPGAPGNRRSYGGGSRTTSIEGTMKIISINAKHTSGITSVAFNIEDPPVSDMVEYRQFRGQFT